MKKICEIWEFYTLFIFGDKEYLKVFCHYFGEEINFCKFIAIHKYITSNYSLFLIYSEKKYFLRFENKLYQIKKKIEKTQGFLILFIEYKFFF